MQPDSRNCDNQLIFANRKAQLLGAVCSGSLAALAAGLWLHYGEQMFFSSLIAAIAGCF